MELSSLIIARLTVFRSKGDHSLSSLFSWADMPPLGGEEPWSLLAICFSVGRTFFEDSHHFDVVVGDGSGGLEHELELAFGGIGIVVGYFSEGSFARLLHSQFHGFDAVEKTFN